MDQTKVFAEQLFDAERLRLAMADSDLDALIAHSKRNYFYLSGFASLDYVIEPEAANFAIFAREGSLAILTIPRSEQMTLLEDPVNAQQILLTGSFHVEGFERADVDRATSPREGLLRALRELKVDRGRIGIESELLPVDTDRWLREQLPHAEIVDASKLLRGLRMVKTPEEVARIRRACEATDAAIAAAIPSVRAGMTEREVARLVARELLDREVDPVYVQVATGAAAGLCGPSDRVLNSGDIVRTDVAATFRGYHSDLGRSFAVGEPTAQQCELYKAAIGALEAGIAAIEDGTPVASVFEAGLAAWHESGYPNVRRHHIGHGVGLQAHEAPMITPDSTATIEAGMVLAVEVPYYVYEIGGFAPEDIVLVQDDGCERFTTAPAELPIA
jgi:Xaa-Pro dipeptidase